MSVFRRHSREAILARLERALPARLPGLWGAGDGAAASLSPAHELHAWINKSIAKYQAKVGTGEERRHDSMGRAGRSGH